MEATVRGVGASPGVATGAVVFQSRDAIDFAARGEKVLLVRIEASSEDVPGIQASAGVVSTRGGLTGDAAIVARALGKPCAIGFPQITVVYGEDLMRVAFPGEPSPRVVRRGELVTLDGSKGTLTFA